MNNNEMTAILWICWFVAFCVLVYMAITVSAWAWIAVVLLGEFETRREGSER